MKYLCLSLSILVVAICALGQTTVGTIEGSVTTENGAPIEGANVLYRRIPEMVQMQGQFKVAPSEALVNRVVTSDANGMFAGPDLPAGQYLVCAAVPGTPYLNPCKWSSPSNATVSANAVSTQSIVLRKGVFLNVRINDPAGLLPPERDRPLGGVRLINGVKFGNGAYLGAVNTGVDMMGRDYQMVIPAGMPMNLWVFSRHVGLADSNGKTVEQSGAEIPFQATAGQDQYFTLTVTGRAPEAESAP